MSIIEYPGSEAVTVAKRNLLQAEADSLRTISYREFSDAFKFEQLVEFMNEIGAAGEPEYAIQLAEMVLLSLVDFDMDDGRMRHKVLLSNATNNWLAGNLDSAMLILDRLLEDENLLEDILVHAATVKFRIMWSLDQRDQSVHYLRSVYERLSNGSELKSSTGLLVAQQSSMVGDYASGLSLIQSIQGEARSSKTAGPEGTEEMLELELAWIKLNLGYIAQAVNILESVGTECSGVEHPKLQNFKAYVSAWCTVVRTGQSLGDAIRDGEWKFASDHASNDSQYIIGKAWAGVQNGDIIGAYNLFREAATDKKWGQPIPAALNSLSFALEGISYTASKLGRDVEAIQALSELYTLQSETGFTISVSGLVHGTTLALCSSDEINTRLRNMRSLRRRAQFTQGDISHAVVRSIFAECKLLQEAALHEQEFQLRGYGQALLAGIPEEETRHSFENEVRIATLAAILGDQSGAEEILDRVLPNILLDYDSNDELTITARYAKTVLLNRSTGDSSNLDELRALQQDIEVVFGAENLMNLESNYSLACALAGNGERQEALSILLAVESNPVYRMASKEFRRLVVSKVAGLFFADGKYVRAVNWYKLVTRASFQNQNDLTQPEIDDHIMYVRAQAKAGRFREARSYFELVVDQLISSDPRNFDVCVEGRIASAACAESLGQYRDASREYLEIINILNLHVCADDPKFWELNISVARNYELSNEQTKAFRHYDEALRVVQTMDNVDEKYVQEIRWRRDCCKQ